MNARTTVICLMAAMLLLSGSTQARGDDAELKRVTVVIKYADGKALSQLLNPYLSKHGRVHFEQRTRAMTLVDEPAIVEVMLKMIKRFDLKPRQIQFVLRLIEADQADKPGKIPPEIQSVVKQIQQVLRYNRFSVLDQSFLAIEANRESSLQVGGENGYSVDMATEMVEQSGDSVRLRFHLYKRKQVAVRDTEAKFVRKTLIATTVELKDGETAVLGASKINGSGKALITVVSMKLK